MDAERPGDAALAPNDEVRFDPEGDPEPGQELPLFPELHVRGEFRQPLALLQENAVRVQGEHIPGAAGASDPDGQRGAVGAVIVDALVLEGAAAGVGGTRHAPHAMP